MSERNSGGGKRRSSGATSMADTTHLDEAERRLVDAGEIEDALSAPATSTADKILFEMQVEMQESLITDLFLLMARVMRKRVGKIQQIADITWDDMMRMKEVHIFCFSMFGVGCNIAIASIFWYSGVVVDGVRYDEPMKVDNLRADSGTVRGAVLIMLQILMSFTTLVTCVLICQKYALIVEEKKRQWSGIETYDLVQADVSKDDTAKARQQKEEMLHKYGSAYTFWRSGFRYSLLVEILIHISHPMIWMYTEGEGRETYQILSILMFLRLYLSVNLVYIFSQEYQLRHEIIASNVDLQRTGFRVTVSATLRMLFFKAPSLFTSLLLLMGLLAFGFIVFVVERNMQPQIATFGSLNNCFWFVFITFTTVGYGDLAPKSLLGRVVAATAGAFGITITTVFGGVVTNLMGQSREQRTISEYLSGVTAGEECRQSAALVIQAAWRYYKRRVGDMVMLNARHGHKSNVVYARIKALKTNRWKVSQSLSTANDPVIDTKMNRISTNLRWAVQAMEKHEKSVTATMCTLESFVMDIGKVLDNRAMAAAGSGIRDSGLK